MSKRLHIFIFLLISAAAKCQTPSSTTTPASATIQELSQGKRDTLIAIDRLFRRRRVGARIWLGFAGGGALTVLRAITEPDTKTPTGATISSTPTAGTVAALMALFAGVPLAIATGKFVTFNQAWQHAIEEAYRNGKPIPYNISRRLKGSFLPRH